MNYTEPSASPPSPGPFLPGAWPPSLHRRSTTCPTSVANPLHLEHVFDFQQRLVTQMDKPPDLPSPSSFVASGSSESALTPADSLDSDLTRFRTDDTSTSLVTDASVSTTYTSRSSPERFVTAKFPQPVFQSKYSAAETNFPTRIPRPTTLTSSISNQSHIRNESHKHKSPFTESSSPPRFQGRRVADSSNTSPPSARPNARPNPSPVSPMIFASPTSSTFPRFKPQQTPRDRSSSFEYNSSPSWETSYGSEYNDQHMLNPPSPSPPSRHVNLPIRPQGSANRTPSIEIESTVPMLMSLSLPASPNTTMSFDTDPIIPRSPRLPPVNEDTTPWGLNLSPASPVLSVVPDLPLSPVDNDHIVTFPPSSPSPFASAFPSPVLDGSELGYVGDTSAAEYAAAVVSSAWGSDGPVLEQVVSPAFMEVAVQADGEDVPDSDILADASVAEEEEMPEPLPYLGDVHYLPVLRQGSKRSSVFGKMKKLSDKFKRLLSGKPKRKTENRGGVNIDVDVRVRNSPVPPPVSLPDIIVIESVSAAHAYNTLLSSQDTDSHLPLPLPPPPGLVTAAKPKARSPQTYSSTTLPRSRTNGNATNRNSSETPLIRVRPSSSASHIMPTGTVTPKTPSPDLTLHSRPKTLAEIKSKRPLSLSLSNFARSSSPVPPVMVSSVHRRRPVTALAFYPRPPPLETLRSTAQATEPVAIAHSRSSTSAFRPTALPRSESARPGSATLTAENQPSADAIKKKNRRFSLSALSNFAAGHWDEGAWQRNGTLRVPLSGV